MLREETVRKRVKHLKRFYMDLINFIIVNIILTLVWLTFDRTGTFWPKYVIVVWGIVLIFRAFRMRIIPLIFPRIAILSQDWEERKVREIMRRRDLQRKIPLNRDEKKD